MIEPTAGVDGTWVALTAPMPESAECHAEDLAPGAHVGDWCIRTLLGRGGTSAVYWAHHAVTAKHAALKVMLAEAASARGAERFALEARVVRELDHPAVPEVYEVGRLADGRPYLVMELLHGRTLGDLIERQRPLFTDALIILLQLCDVLAVAHRRGVVHRDLKPDNVIVLDGQPVAVKLLDWGIAKLVDDHVPGSTLTCTGAIIGTPRYLSPEQARSQLVDARSDVYCLGLVAYELLLGAFPFENGSAGETLMMHMIQPPRSPRRFWRDVPAELERLLLMMLAKDPAHRPPLSDVTRRLRALQRGAAIPAVEAEHAAIPSDFSDDRATSRGRRIRRDSV